VLVFTEITGVAYSVVEPLPSPAALYSRVSIIFSIISNWPSISSYILLFKLLNASLFCIKVFLIVAI
jgi:hypothetical protein